MQKSIILLVTVLLCTNFHNCYARSRRNNPACNEDQQKKMNEEFTKCLKKYTNEHHEASGKATSPEDYQKYTCKLLSDTVECGALWSRCQSPTEVRYNQDTYIQARITQFRDNEDGIDVFKCPTVVEYINSGRADRIDQTTEGGCSVAQISEVQQDFQQCSHEKSLKLYEDIQKLQEGRFSRDTNDLASELSREDASLDPLKDIKPRLCATLKAIAKDCQESFNKCFSREDSEQIKAQHIEQMQKYYARIYKDVGDLKDCPGLKIHETESEDDYDEEDYDYYDEDYEEQENDYVSSTTPKTEEKSTSSTVSDYSEDEIYPDDPEIYPDDPEGNAVIAEPPSFIGHAKSPGLLCLNSVLLSICSLLLIFS